MIDATSFVLVVASLDPHRSSLKLGVVLHRQSCSRIGVQGQWFSTVWRDAELGAPGVRVIGHMNTLTRLTLQLVQKMGQEQTPVGLTFKVVQ